MESHFRMSLHKLHAMEKSLGLTTLQASPQKRDASKNYLISLSMAAQPRSATM